jgi:hypothetical protein
MGSPSTLAHEARTSRVSPGGVASGPGRERRGEAGWTVADRVARRRISVLLQLTGIPWQMMRPTEEACNFGAGSEVQLLEPIGRKEIFRSI